MAWWQALINLAVTVAGVAIGAVLGAELGIRVAARRIKKIAREVAPQLASAIKQFLGSGTSIDVLAKIAVEASREREALNEVPTIESVERRESG